MPDLPLPTQHDVVIQNGTQVDYLQFTGTTLTGSFLVNYPGIAGWNIVASSDFSGDNFPDLVVQNATTGQLDFLLLNANAQMIGSALGPVVPPVHGQGQFGGVVGVLVSQLPNGQIDLLQFDSPGHMLRTDLIANTVGLPPIVGAAGGFQLPPAMQGVGDPATFNYNVVAQLADGSIDVLGFSGSMFLPGPGVTMSASFLLPGTAGSPQLFALDQDFSLSAIFSRDINAFAFFPTIRETIEMVGQLPNGQIDHLFFDSGYNDVANRGVEIGTLAENFFVPTGWHIVDAGIVAHTDLFPIM
jgi:hypothetical protein